MYTNDNKLNKSIDLEKRIAILEERDKEKDNLIEALISKIENLELLILNIGRKTHCISEDVLRYHERDNRYTVEEVQADYEVYDMLNPEE